MRRLLFILTLTLSLAASAVTPNLVRQADRKAMTRWVDSVYNSLNENQRIAQVLCPKMVPTQGQLSKNTIKNWVGNIGVGGLLFTEGNIDQFAGLTDYAQSLAKVPVLMTLDGEWGLAMRVRNTQRFPNNMACGAVSDEKLVYDYGREVGRQCRLLGIHANFAPVADVNSNSKNPVIGYRSFGEDPQRVARLVSAYSRGLESMGVQAVAKHWPGHGDTDSDSHKTLPTVAKTKSQLDAVELVPFRKFVNDGGSGIMTAHLAMPKIDKSGSPASMSAPLYTMLRNDLGFEGLTYTDALTMKGAANASKNPCVAALQAGADMLLSSSNPTADIDAIAAAVKNGTIPAERLEQAVRRVLTYKYILARDAKTTKIAGNNLASQLNSPQAEAVNRALTAATMTVLKSDNILPIKGLATAEISAITLGAPSDDAFATTLAKYAPVKIAAFTAGKTYNSTALPSDFGGNTLIVGVYNDKAETQRALKTIVDEADDETKLIVAFMVNPYKMSHFDKAVFDRADAVVLAYDDTRLCREYAAQAIFGGIDVDGRLPVTLEGLYKAGTGVKLTKNRLGYSAPELEGLNAELTTTIDSLVNLAISKGAMPGCQVLVARHGNVVFDKSYGKLTAGGAPVTPNTLYDLASVSKTIGTLPGVMLAVDKGLIDIDSKASTYIPGLRGTNKENITVRQLLYHESGMQPSLNMFNIMIDPATYSGKLIAGKADATHPYKIQNGAFGHRDGKLRTDLTSTERRDGYSIAAGKDLYLADCAYDSIMSNIYRSPLRKDNSYAYSCLNFCLLMDAEQQVTKTPHMDFCRENIWAPLGMTTMTYRPLDNGFTTADIAPTEQDNYLRRQLVHGYVHDELADFSGGIQGNAGLFANAGDLAKMCQMWLNDGSYGGETILSPETTRLFTHSKSKTCRRGLGFDKPDTVRLDWSPCCDEADASVYGHTGFTGTCFWVDPVNDFIYIFLCNRVNPTRDNSAFAKYSPRAKIMAAIYNSINDNKQK